MPIGAYMYYASQAFVGLSMLAVLYTHTHSSISQFEKDNVGGYKCVRTGGWASLFLSLSLTLSMCEFSSFNWEKENDLCGGVGMKHRTEENIIKCATFSKCKCKISTDRMSARREKGTQRKKSRTHKEKSNKSYTVMKMLWEKRNKKRETVSHAQWFSRSWNVFVWNEQTQRLNDVILRHIIEVYIGVYRTRYSINTECNAMWKSCKQRSV